MVGVVEETISHYTTVIHVAQTWLERHSDVRVRSACGWSMSYPRSMASRRWRCTHARRCATARTRRTRPQSNRPPKKTASVPTSVGQLFGIITPCSWVMSVTSCASAWSKDSGAGQSTLSMRGSAPHSRSGTHCIARRRSTARSRYTSQSVIRTREPGEHAAHADSGAGLDPLMRDGSGAGERE